MSPFLERLNANLEKALAKKKKKKKEETLAESATSSALDVEAKVSFVKAGNVIDPDLSAKVKDFLFQVISKHN
jgi:hypothetical protein